MSSESDSEEEQIRPFWYGTLVEKEGRKGLVSYYDSKQLNESCIVRIETHDKKHKYSLFNTYIVLCNYIWQCDSIYRCMHEVVRSNHTQKPRFDIDVKSDKLPDGVDIVTYADKIKDETITAILDMFSEINITLSLEKNILVYSSHGDSKGIYKRSYHIIVDGYCHKNNKEAGAFFEEVVNKGNLHEYVEIGHLDPAVYKSNQCFRLLWNHKYGEDRIKEFNETFTYLGVEYTHKYPVRRFNNPNHKKIHLLGASLLSNTAGCSLLPDYYIEPLYDKFDISDEDTQKCMDICTAYFSGKSKKKRKCPFKFAGRTDSLISLQRLYPSHCELCNRVHHSCPPYMYINSQGDIHWSCGRRSKLNNKSIVIGHIDISYSTPIDIDTKVTAVSDIYDKIRYIDETYTDIDTMDSTSNTSNTNIDDDICTRRLTIRHRNSTRSTIPVTIIHIDNSKTKEIEEEKDPIQEMKELLKMNSKRSRK